MCDASNRQQPGFAMRDCRWTRPSREPEALPTAWASPRSSNVDVGARPRARLAAARAGLGKCARALSEAVEVVPGPQAAPLCRAPLPRRPYIRTPLLETRTRLSYRACVSHCPVFHAIWVSC
jgi:hypothetical protein